MNIIQGYIKHYLDIGFHNVKINIKKTLTSMAHLFDFCYYIKSVKFLPGFDSSKVTSMREMFYNTYIETIDMKNLEFNSLLA